MNMEMEPSVPNIEKEKELNSTDVFFFRHSKAKYKTYAEVLASDDPEGPVDYEKQVENDADLEFAKEEAKKFLSGLDPNKSAFFFVSSDEMRALETAKVFLDEARERGFEIISPEKAGSKTTEKVGVGKIRKVNTISLGIKNALLGSIFNPEKYMPEVNWDAVSEETKEKWKEAREIIDADDKGSWGSNFFHHSKALKEIFPEIRDAEDVFESQFKGMLRLIKFAVEKKKKNESAKDIKVLAFGHENYIGYALSKYFEENEINNCESLGFDVEDGKIKLTYRGEEKIIEDI